MISFEQLQQWFSVSMFFIYNDIFEILNKLFMKIKSDFNLSLHHIWW